ncbi:murein biosynthesis integral membrane protein MurJ [Phytomonospora endophytica]|uniref:Putative peptidoglycan lipid II flippase n=1 Tax=Phytomonospora endophytica TaxID=714109 RepID=A0A841FI93_9ACTN|nr:lipid II flippase MurJ [Phytomonospora endophytica]MBB6035926.1 putative peptidoglycan lipid II flippase [Phytomonospora endophytica]GIG71076.1 membrane protein [Phytomonospora endophytica]
MRQAAATGEGGRIGGAAALIAGITVASRLAGFARVLVFGWAVGVTDLGTIYQTANTVPNIIFEIVAGGALASLVIPVLAAPIARKDPATVARTASAMLTWACAILVPIAVLVAVFAEEIIGLLSANAGPEMTAVGTRMLQVFAPQLPLYGIGIVLTGVLQAHRRFAWPALAPLLSSVTVIGAYTIYGLMGEPDDLAGVSRAGELVLSVGTTLGVVVLSGCLVVPTLRLGVRVRPTFSFSDGLGAKVKSLALAGAVTVGAQQLATLVVIYLTNPPAGPGALVNFTIANTLYLLPWAVLVVPVATAAYPTLAGAFAEGDDERFDRTLSSTTRMVLLLSGLGTAALVVLARPLAELLNPILSGSPDADQLTTAVMGLAPGLIGYGLFALLTRALYARGDTAKAAGATVLGWGVVMAATMTLAGILPNSGRLFAVTVGNSIGMVVLGAALITVVAVRVGRSALVGVPRAFAVTVLAGGLALAAGLPLVSAMNTVPPLWTGVCGGAVVLVVYGAVTVLLDRHDVRPLIGRVTRRFGRG